MDYDLKKADKYRRNINRFLAVGGAGAIVGLFATAPELASNLTAQNIGMYAAIIAAIGIGGAMWNWAAQEDLKSGRTISTEFKDIKASFGNVLSRIRKEFDDEFATNQGLDNKDGSTVKKKISIK
jgi:hypothetical protein